MDNAQLLSIVERIERLLNEADSINEGVKEVYAEAKSAGYDPKYIKKCIALRKKDPDEIDEEDEMMKMYRDALGL